MCLSGAKIGPEEGYWRKDNYTDNFLRCFEGNVSCISLFRNKSTSSNYSATGNCGPGYYGALCTACMPGYKRYEQVGAGNSDSCNITLFDEPGYSRSGGYKCKKCEDF